MKAMLFQSTLYHHASDNSLTDCLATDYVFTPLEKPIADANAEKMTEAIKALLSVRSGKTTNIWIGTPNVNSTNAWSDYTAAQLTQFIQDVYDELDEFERNKVVGVYMTQESIYGDMDYNNILGGTKPANNQIRIMKQVRDYVKAGHVHGTQFMWCPYYGYGDNAATIIKKIGHVADKVQIFDYVILQPHVIFDASTTNGNLNGVKYSVDRNKVCYRNNVNVIASKVSTTKIGYEMEYVPGKDSLFADYTTTFASYKQKPWMFYWQGDLNQAIGEINDWV